MVSIHQLLLVLLDIDRSMLYLRNLCLFAYSGVYVQKNGIMYLSADVLYSADVQYT